MHLRRHVEHVLDAVDLLLDRRGDGVGDDLGVRARGSCVVTWIVGGAISGYCASGSVKSAIAADQRDDDREDRGEDRPVDEEVREFIAAPDE